MFFNQYPYLNLNDLNLDYILKAIGEMKYEVTNFVSINAIKYADPIQWNITSQYEKNTIVIDPVTGTAYISVAPVPSGVSLTRPEYWTVVFDLGSFVTRAAQNFTSRWESETTTTATFPTTTGGWLVWGDVLYKALTNITAGDTYVVGGNIEHFTIEDLYNAYLNTIANILALVGDLADLNTSDKTSIVNAINEVVANIGDLADLDTSDKTSIVTAVNELVAVDGALRTDVDWGNNIVNLRSYLYNKNVVVYGDSTVALTPSYMTMAAAIGGFNVTNRAVAATTMNHNANSGVSLINSDNDLINFDTIFLCYGTNEWNGDFDLDTIYSDVETILSVIWAQNPAISVFFVLPWFQYIPTRQASVKLPLNSRGYTQRDVLNKITDALDLYSIPIIDLYARSSCNFSNYSSKLELSNTYYFHATDDFKTEIASLIIQGTNERYRPKWYTPMLTSIDFPYSQNAAGNVSDWVENLMLKLTGTESSTYKTFYQLYEYEIVGNTDAEITINVGNMRSYTVNGAFKITCPKWTFNNAFALINVTTAGVANIKNFQIFAITDTPIDASNLQYNLGLNTLTNANANVTPYAPITYSYKKDGIFIKGGAITVNNALVNGDVLLTLDASINLPQTFIPIINPSYETEYLEVIGNTIKVWVSGMTTGVYILPNTFIPINYNMQAARPISP